MNLRKRITSLLVAGLMSFYAPSSVANDTEEKVVDTRKNEEIDWLHYDNPDYLKKEVKGFSDDYSVDEKTGCMWVYEKDTVGKGRGQRVVQAYNSHGDTLELIDREYDGWFVALPEDSLESRQNPDPALDVILISRFKSDDHFYRNRVEGRGGGDESALFYAEAERLYRECAEPIAGRLHRTIKPNADTLELLK